MAIQFQRLTQATTEAASDINRLLPQLSTHPHTITVEQLEQLIVQPLHYLYIACDNERIIGMMTFVGYLIPTGEKWQLEDVVIDQGYRGKGHARSFMKWAIAQFREQHPTAAVHLTSRPSRLAANNLYRSLGFKAKDTNNYTF